MNLWTNNRTAIEAVLVGHAFSLTPALSRWEREAVPPRHLLSGAFRPFTASAIVKRLTTILPLPAREGRGEGERPLQTKTRATLLTFS